MRVNKAYRGQVIFQIYQLPFFSPNKEVPPPPGCTVPALTILLLKYVMSCCNFAFHSCKTSVKFSPMACPIQRKEALYDAISTAGP